MTGGEPAARAVRDHLVAELPEQRHELVEAAVHVADDVERSVLVLQVVPERLALDADGIHLLGGGEHEDVAEALALEATERPAELLSLLTNDVGPEVPVLATAVPLQTEALGKVEHDRDRQAVVASRERDERLARWSHPRPRDAPRRAACRR